MTALAPWRPPTGPAAPPEVARRYLNKARRWLHPDPYPEITARHEADGGIGGSVGVAP